MRKISKSEIESVCNKNVAVRIDILNRPSVYGKVVRLKDFEELLVKGMFRFVMNSNLNVFENEFVDLEFNETRGWMMHTKILSISSLEKIHS